MYDNMYIYWSCCLHIIILIMPYFLILMYFISFINVWLSLVHDEEPKTTHTQVQQDNKKEHHNVCNF